jgi:hypothetical protein
MYRTDFEHPDWQPRDVNVIRQQAEAWWDASTLGERDAIFAEYGVCWSELWRLPYWNPSRMLVVDAMHCILEGLVHYHCRHVLEIDAEKAQSAEKPAQAFSFQWPRYVDAEVAERFKLKTVDLQTVLKLHKLLETALNSGGGQGGIEEGQMWKGLNSRTVAVLKYLCWSLGVLPTDGAGSGKDGRVLKKDYVEKLMGWVRKDTVPYLYLTDSMISAQHPTTAGSRLRVSTQNHVRRGYRLHPISDRRNCCTFLAQFGT